VNPNSFRAYKILRPISSKNEPKDNILNCSFIELKMTSLNPSTTSYGTALLDLGFSALPCAKLLVLARKVAGKKSGYLMK
jgi:hypothetical protein